MRLTGKRILVCGNGLSGQAVFSKVKELGGEPSFYTGGDFKREEYDFAVVSPSISKKGELYFKFNSLGLPAYSEIDFAYLIEPRTIIAVTGTNGKTTTVRLVEGMLRESGVDAVAAGNIGIPLTASRKAGVTVCEVSSFMLEQSSFFRADYSAITNIRPDHLDRHGTFGEYDRLKRKLFALTLLGVAIPKENDYTIKEGLKRVTYSREERADVYVSNVGIYYKNERIIDLEDVRIKGVRNQENILVALSLCIAYRGYDDRYARFLRSYEGEPYRMAYRGRIKGKEVYNDSKGTNVAATIAAINELKSSVALLLGGYGKREDYGELLDEMGFGKVFYCIFGKNKNEIAEECEKRKVGYKVFESIESALDYAFSLRVDNILFSPTTSSFDEFSSYEERGKYFDELLEKYKL